MPSCCARSNRGWAISVPNPLFGDTMTSTPLPEAGARTREPLSSVPRHHSAKSTPNSGSSTVRPILLDTNAYMAFMLGAAAVVDVVAHADKLYLNSIVLGELLGGFAAGSREPKNRAELAHFLDSPRVEVLTVTAQTADSYALVYA